MCSSFVSAREYKFWEYYSYITKTSHPLHQACPTLCYLWMSFTTSCKKENTIFCDFHRYFRLCHFVLTTKPLWLVGTSGKNSQIPFIGDSAQTNDLHHKVQSLEEDPKREVKTSIRPPSAVLLRPPPSAFCPPIDRPTNHKKLPLTLPLSDLQRPTWGQSYTGFYTLGQIYKHVY